MNFKCTMLFNLYLVGVLQSGNCAEKGINNLPKSFQINGLGTQPESPEASFKATVSTYDVWENGLPFLFYHFPCLLCFLILEILRHN